MWLRWAATHFSAIGKQRTLHCMSLYCALLCFVQLVMCGVHGLDYLFIYDNEAFEMLLVVHGLHFSLSLLHFFHRCLFFIIAYIYRRIYSRFCTYIYLPIHPTAKRDPYLSQPTYQSVCTYRYLCTYVCAGWCRRSPGAGQRARRPTPCSRSLGMPCCWSSRHKTTGRVRVRVAVREGYTAATATMPAT
jgi:hypothetical protein